MKLFFSHDSNNKSLVQNLIDIIDNLKPCDYDKFFSSEPKTGINVGNDIIEEINNNLDNSDLVLRRLYQKHLLFIYEIVTSRNMYHNPIKEMINVIPEIIYNGHYWQGKNSFFGNQSRIERK